MLRKLKMMANGVDRTDIDDAAIALAEDLYADLERRSFSKTLAKFSLVICNRRIGSEIVRPAPALSSWPHRRKSRFLMAEADVDLH
jgi:hypothetical protein